MTDKFDKLNETFDIEPQEVESKKIKKIEDISSSVEDIKKIMNTLVETYTQL